MPKIVRFHEFGDKEFALINLAGSKSVLCYAVSVKFGGKFVFQLIKQLSGFKSLHPLNSGDK